MKTVIEALEKEIKVFDSYIKHIKSDNHIHNTVPKEKRDRLISECEAKKIPFQQAIKILNGKTVKRRVICFYCDKDNVNELNDNWFKCNICGKEWQILTKRN